MKILFLSSWFPYPPDNGARNRTYNLLNALSARHEVFLISQVQKDSDPCTAALPDSWSLVSLHPAKQFDGRMAKSIIGLLSSRPRSFVDTHDPELGRAVRATISTLAPDVVVASTLDIAAYVPSDVAIPTVLDEHNCEYAVLMRHAKRVSSTLRRIRATVGWKKFARWEARLCRRFDSVVTVSDCDKRHLLEVAPDLRPITVIPNGVDTDHFTPMDHAPDPNMLVYNGALTYGANLDAVRYFASDIHPLLANSLPQAKLLVTGRTAGVDMRGIADCPGIEMTGYVDDIRDVLRKSAACIVPLREGGGSRLKILEAMAAGVPVVSTSMGAEGIDAEHGTHLLVADDPSEFAEAIVSVLADDTLAESLIRNARELVEARYSWSAIGERFVQVVEAAARARCPALA